MWPFDRKKRREELRRLQKECLEEVTATVKSIGHNLSSEYISSSSSEEEPNRGKNNFVFRKWWSYKNEGKPVRIDVRIRNLNELVLPASQRKLEERLSCEDYPTIIENYVIIGLSWNPGDYELILTEWLGEFYKRYTEDKLSESGDNTSQETKENLQKYVKEYEIWKNRSDWEPVTCDSCGGRGGSLYGYNDFSYGAADWENCSACGGSGISWPITDVKFHSLPRLPMELTASDIKKVTEKHQLFKPPRTFGVYAKIVPKE